MYGVLFQYNPSFDMDRNLNGIKVRVTFEEGTVLEYAMNPLNNGMTLTMERVTEDELLSRPETAFLNSSSDLKPPLCSF